MSGALWLWELPQSLLGLGLLAVQRARGRVHGVERTADGRRLVETEGIGISLGAFVFWSRADLFGRPFDVPLIRAHELGHTVQSRRLGWLYLPTVGIASSSRAVYALLWQRRHGRPWPRYFDAWPEDMADPHGGVRRGADGARHLPAGSPLDPDPLRGC